METQNRNISRNEDIDQTVSIDDEDILEILSSSDDVEILNSSIDDSSSQCNLPFSFSSESVIS